MTERCLQCFRNSVTCCLCNILCCECNCVIFPAPNPSYDSGVVCLNEDGVKTVIVNFLINGKQIPYAEVSTEKSKQSKKCFIYFHGKAQDIGIARLFLQSLVLELNITFYAIQYPNYGQYQTYWGAYISNTIKEDALNFYDTLLKQKQRTTDDIFVMGRSIGSGGACYLAGNRKIPILILMSPFDSIKKVASSMVGCIGYIVKQHFNNEQEIIKHNGQLLVIHGESDEVIGVKHGKNLVAIFQDKSKKVVTTNYPKRMTHNNFKIEKDIIQPIKNTLEM